MRITGTSGLVVLSIAIAIAPAVAGQAGPSDRGPRPPATPLPPPPGDLPVGPSSGPFDPNAVSATLEQVLAALQNGMDRLWQWLDALRQAAAGALTQIVSPLPVQGPVMDPLTVITQIAGLPASWGAIAAAALAKAAMPPMSDPTSVQHGADIAGSPELSHEAASIDAADQQVTSGAVQHELAAGATATMARAAVEDGTLPAAAAAAAAAGDALLSDAGSIPSSRAGIEILIAGMGAGLRHEAALTVALADRLTGLMQQNAQLSGQTGALASTISVLAERSLERDRDALNARLGAADAGQGAVDMFAQLLQGAADTSGEISLDPLY